MQEEKNEIERKVVVVVVVVVVVASHLEFLIKNRYQGGASRFDAKNTQTAARFTLAWRGSFWVA